MQLAAVQRFKSKNQLRQKVTVWLTTLYRYYDPVTGRWPSRDPLGNWGDLRGDIQNIYCFIGNATTYSIDFLGLTRIVGHPNGEASNCLGGGISGRGDVYAYPDHTKDSDKSFVDAMKRGGWNAKEVKNKDDCKCECDEEKILITLYRNDDPANKGKNPWTDPKFEWNKADSNGNPLSDIHTIRAMGGGCSNKYHQIPHAEQFNQEFDENIDEKLFQDNPMLCACKPKK